ncbi:MAG TPA: U32 family peptidase [Polyangia bacterium]|jgi:putative protease
MEAPSLSIKAPVDSLAEAAAVIDAGADELFCAVRLGATSCSCQRAEPSEEKVSLSGPDELAALVALAHGRGIKVHVALNDPRPSVAALAVIRASLPRLQECGVDGVIVSNLAELRLVRATTTLPVVAGSYFSAINPEAVAFLERLGVESVFLERQIARADLRALAAARPRVALGAFVMATACRSLALYCHRQLPPERPDDRVVHWCQLPLGVAAGEGAPPPAPEALARVARRLRMPRSSCGLCALPALATHGVTIAKIVGRGHPTEVKVRHVHMVRAARDALAAAPAGADYFAAARALHRDHFQRPCTPDDCYYPHLH